MSDYMHKEYKLPNGRTVTADFNELGCAMVTIQAMDALFEILNSSDVVEVVRCKDCIYKEECGQEVWLNEYTTDKSPSVTGVLFYCSYGERAEA